MSQIVGVAIKHSGDVHTLPKPNRHHHVIWHMVDEMNVPPPITGMQGFYTDEGDFLTREQALTLALRTGQITTHDHPTKLFSEDLW